MENKTTLQELSRHISNTGQMVIYRYFDDAHKQVLGIKKSVTVSESGLIYFSMTTQFEDKFSDPIFPVEFFAYKKGSPYYVTGKGIAQKLLNGYQKNVCVKMEAGEVVKTAKPQPVKLLSNCMSMVNNFICLF